MKVRLFWLVCGCFSVSLLWAQEHPFEEAARIAVSGYFEGTLEEQPLALTLCARESRVDGRLAWKNEEFLVNAQLSSGIVSGRFENEAGALDFKVSVVDNRATLQMESGSTHLSRRPSADWDRLFENDAVSLKLNRISGTLLRGELHYTGQLFQVEANAHGALCWGTFQRDDEQWPFTLVRRSAQQVTLRTGNYTAELTDTVAVRIFTEESRQIRAEQEKLAQEERADRAAAAEEARRAREAEEKAEQARQQAELARQAAARQAALASIARQLVQVPAGRFMMGSERSRAEMPVREVEISRPFWIGCFEVTQAQFEAVMQRNPSSFRGGDRPVDGVSWEGAMAFCQALNERFADDLPAGYEYRLPTEAEWEYAARGADRSKGYLYAGSNTLDVVGWYDTNNEMVTHPVGRKKPNELGLYDMSGNIYEWCFDWYADTYEGAPAVDPQGPDKGRTRVLRGGCWAYTADTARVTARFCLDPAYASLNLGFRIVLGPSLRP